MASPFTDPAFYADRYPTYAALRKRSPVLQVPMDGGALPAAVVTGFDQARAALADPALSKDTAAFFAGRPSGRSLHPALATTMLNSDPPDHTRLRRLVTRAFTPATVDALRPYIGALAEQLAEGWSPGQRVDLVESFAAPLPVTVICQLLGVPTADRDGICQWSTDLFVTGDHQRIDAASHSLADYMAELVVAKRSDPDEDLLSALVAARDSDGDQLSEQELVSLAVLLLVAGHETTTAAIGNAVLALLRHPDQLELLRSAPDRTAGAVDELLRFDSPVSIATWRWAPEPVRIGETDVPAGSPVFVSPGAANRDPARFSDPDRLDLEREARSHLAFGHGIHRCLGAPLAQAEVEIALRVLLERFPGLRLAEPADQLRWRHSRLVRGLESLPVLL
ncbi:MULTISPECIES: cytochrome P450 [unclassified Kitasatospora]|uniref:cytochrome P450 family protein n=1 Tax=unclassified Kitasatospora TaxID=2633591 RepID=UPI000708F6B2|nr:MULTISPECIES: cytochrome P450 [unclassified Kitasatospora]KQV20888.1 cytochrome [Kitasatospora sp. Root107]KRB60458.1 cytochrome [Kitasatospora sp. Root187]